VALENGPGLSPLGRGRQLPAGGLGAIQPGATARLVSGTLVPGAVFPTSVS
jgi:hypothetical protein